MTKQYSLAPSLHRDKSIYSPASRSPTIAAHHGIAMELMPTPKMLGSVKKTGLTYVATTTQAQSSEASHNRASLHKPRQC